MEKSAMPRRGQFVLWANAWHEVLWVGRTRSGTEMVKLRITPGERPFYVPLARLGPASESNPDSLDAQLDRRLAREE